jgi:hypothetical protein
VKSIAAVLGEGGRLGGHGINRQPSHRTAASLERTDRRSCHTSEDSSGCGHWAFFAIAFFDSHDADHSRGLTADFAALLLLLRDCAMLQCIHCCPWSAALTASHVGRGCGLGCAMINASSVSPAFCNQHRRRVCRSELHGHSSSKAAPRGRLAPLVAAMRRRRRVCC